MDSKVELKALSVCAVRNSSDKRPLIRCCVNNNIFLKRSIIFVPRFVSSGGGALLRDWQGVDSRERSSFWASPLRSIEEDFIQIIRSCFDPMALVQGMGWGGAEFGWEGRPPACLQRLSVVF
ncbi:hypothetical protein AVEN_175336-1 [Araneus ventricosus]|uniref:Uncharacterized protein n=1 Tax=Araneus ventricosus TaxID=182803 RepID=A0A4Y2GZW6_ARAVE|nr:hypothetical protein AVEN_175336-1 [Araneus ventricosus]